MSQHLISVGDKVNVIREDGCFYLRVEWWPETGMTGTVEAIHKNGSVRVACHQLRNKSEDGYISKTFKKGEMRYEKI